MTPPIETEEATTPPILSSSPGIEPMDISPLPHKLPHFVSQVTLPSPTPGETPDLSSDITPDLLSADEQTLGPASEIEAPTFLQLPEYACLSW